MDPNAPMSWLDMPPSYDGPTQFAPAIPDTRNPYSFTATRDRAFQLEQMKQQEAQMRLQSILEEKRRQREADQAMPFLQALDPTADTYSEQRRKALLSLPPSALTNPHVQNLVRDQDYLHRASSRSTDDPRVAKVLAEDPGQFETYQDDLEKLTPKEAANRLWSRHNDNKLKVELASSGYDGDFNDLLGERGYIDPVKAALWKNKNGVRNQAMTDDDRKALLSLHRSSSRSTDDPRVAKVLAEDPGQFETYQDDLEKLTPKEAANRLWSRHNDNKLKVELASSGYDGDFNDLLGERGYIDPVKAALWKNKNGVRNQAMTEDDRDKLLKELGDVVMKRDDPNASDDFKKIADARVNTLRQRLGGLAPPLESGKTAPPPSPTGPISTEEAPKYWQESKKELAKHFMEAAGGDAQKFSQMLGNPEDARNALSTFPRAGKPAFTYPRGIFTNDDVHWGEVLEALRHDQGMVGGMGGNSMDATGSGTRVGQKLQRPPPDPALAEFERLK